MAVFLDLLSRWFTMLEEEAADVQDLGNEKYTGN